MTHEHSDDPRSSLHAACDPEFLKAWNAGQLQRMMRQKAEIDAILEQAKSDPELRRRLDKPLS